MELKTCEYCGTSFDAQQTQCPLCGKATNTAPAEPVILRADGSPAPRKPSRGGKRLAKNRARAKAEAQSAAPCPYAIPLWMMRAICIILGLACLAGAAFAIYNLKWFAPREQESTDTSTQQTVSVPASQTQPSKEQYMNEEDYLPPEGEQTEEPTEPADPVSCTGLTLSSRAVTFEEVEQFYNITYTRTPADCTESVTFTSDNEAIATVNQQGKIVAINAGSAVITATCGEYSATCLVTCDFKSLEEPEQTDEPAALSLNNEDMTFFSPGEQFTLSVKNAPEDTYISYTSADPSVATVSARGLVTAMGSGTTTITVAVDGYDTALECIVRCNLGDSSEETGASGSYTISHEDVTMSLMGEYFKLRLLDEDGDAVSDVAWTSGDSSVCTVDAKGIVTASGKGTTTVSTTYRGTTYKCIVRCNLS